MIANEEKERIEIITFTVSSINALITDRIREEIINVIGNSNPRVIIDLGGVEYIDSSGFGCFLSIMRAVRSSCGILKFANPGPAVKEIFETLHLHTVFQIYDNVDLCIKSFNQP
jgi:anti-sigma B factor antagonist